MSSRNVSRLIVCARVLAVAVFLVILLFPIFWTTTMAFKPAEEWAPTDGTTYWLPEDWTLSNFIRVLNIGDTGGFGGIIEAPLDATPSIIRSLIAGIGGTLLALVCGTLTAYGISRHRAGGRHHPFSILQMRMFPPIAVIVPILFLWTYLQLFDTVHGLALVYGAVTFPFVVWLMLSFFDEIPREIGEAARVDGCSRMGVFVKAILPLARNGLATTALFVFILNWSDFIIALSLTDANKTAPVFLNEITSASTGREFGPQAALGLILMLPPLVLAVFIQKHLVRGMTFGAIKR